MSQWQSQTRKMNRHYQSRGSHLVINKDSFCITGLRINGRLATLPYTIWEPDTEYLTGDGRTIGSTPFNYTFTPAYGGKYRRETSGAEGNFYFGVSAPVRTEIQYAPVELTAEPSSSVTGTVLVKDGDNWTMPDGAEKITLTHSSNEIRDALIPVYDKYSWVGSFVSDTVAENEDFVLPEYFNTYEEKGTDNFSYGPEIGATVDADGNVTAGILNGSHTTQFISHFFEKLFGSQNKPIIPDGDLVYFAPEYGPLIGTISGGDNRERATVTNPTSTLKSEGKRAYNTQLMGDENLVIPGLALGIYSGSSTTSSMSAFAYQYTGSNGLQYGVSFAREGSFNSYRLIWFDGFSGTAPGGVVSNYLWTVSPIMRNSSSKYSRICVVGGYFRILRKIKIVRDVTMTKMKTEAAE